VNRLAIVIALVAATGCKGKDQDAKPDEAAPAPATGPLTIERIMAAKGVVSPLDPWDRGLAKLEATLGKPTRVVDDEHQWAVVEGDTCAYLTVSREDGAPYQQPGPVVGMVMSPMTVEKDGPMMNRRDCLAITGVAAGPPEDPDAPSPPEDGSAVPVADFRDAAVKARSRWKGKAVTVAGVLTGTSTSTSGADSWVTVKLKAATDEAGDAVSCSLPKNAEAPAVAPGQAVLARGTVDIAEWMSAGDDSSRLEARLSECTIEAAP
jgi:hypothetical protein